MTTPPKMGQNSTPEESEYGVFWGDDLFKEVPNKMPIIEHFLYEKDVIFITAQAGVGKSVFILQMIANLTAGTPFLDSFAVPKPCKVLLLQTEGDRAETIARVKCIDRVVKYNHNNWVHLNLDGICLNTDEGHKEFMDFIEKPKFDYDVIVIDPLYTTVKGSVSNDEVVTEWVRHMRKVRMKYKCAFVVAHHETIKDFYVDGSKVLKGSKDLMGSSFWGAFGSYNYKIFGDKDHGYKLIRGKERNPKIIDNLSLRLIEPDPLRFIIADEGFSLSETQVLKILEDSRVPYNAAKIISATGLSRATVYRILRNLHTQNKISKISEGENVLYTSTVKNNNP